jgi:hypothetical protein
VVSCDKGFVVQNSKQEGWKWAWIKGQKRNERGTDTEESEMEEKKLNTLGYI